MMWCASLILRDRPDWQICGEAENGAQALQKERQLRPDLIILDVTMPDIGRAAGGERTTFQEFASQNHHSYYA
jgi:DNA-binding NarL/FixJ family response regulator